MSLLYEKDLEDLGLGRCGAGWREFILAEARKKYFGELMDFLREEYSAKTIFPPKELVFAAFAVDFDAVKVVILGQDPYHTPGMAEGLAFSVPEGAELPPSLVNIYKEVAANFGGEERRYDDGLISWRDQGVLLLNTVLTVEAHRAGSHRGKGWEIFTTEVIKELSASREHLVFLLWGNDARNKKQLIDPARHLVLEAPHPSPLSAYRGFLGCGHFLEANKYLHTHGIAEIEW